MLKILSCVVLGLLIVIDWIPALVDKKDKTHIPLEEYGGFWSVYGLAACIIIILASKAFGHAGIMKREDYYDE
jgi:hypothetical protein